MPADMGGCIASGIDPNCWCNVSITKGQARSLLNCILQVYNYLVLAKVGFGVLTDIQNWYLFKRDHSDCLYISVGFKWKNRQPHLPAAIAYLISTSVYASGEFDVPPEEGERPWSYSRDVTPYTSPNVGYGTTANSKIVHVATELIDGSQLGPGK
uniref:Uncharacterized protein n=1 Tax=Physcomitrium patens TaxID=3218 RepID=A0A2K1IV18_PHYPA|nr:hypothetical protein PHYPA_025063 [Physcomitrium patens]